MPSIPLCSRPSAFLTEIITIFSYCTNQVCYTYPSFSSSSCSSSTSNFVIMVTQEWRLGGPTEYWILILFLGFKPVPHVKHTRVLLCMGSKQHSYSDGDWSFSVRVFLIYQVTVLVALRQMVMMPGISLPRAPLCLEFKTVIYEQPLSVSLWLNDRGIGATSRATNCKNWNHWCCRRSSSCAFHHDKSMVTGSQVSHTHLASCLPYVLPVVHASESDTFD
jgi:hypothetical protein